jgi:hypothetical protein
MDAHGSVRELLARVRMHDRKRSDRQTRAHALTDARTKLDHAHLDPAGPPTGGGTDDDVTIRPPFCALNAAATGRILDGLEDAREDLVRNAN